MDIRKIRKLIELIQETGVAEIEIKDGEESVRISRTSTVTPAQAPIMNITAAPPPAAAVVTTPATEAPQSPLSPQGHTVKSPMVGTVYLAASPEADLFVQVGQQVKAGETLCLIEAMKMFNEIEADIDGRITACFIENGQPVEYGQPLFTIE